MIVFFLGCFSVQTVQGHNFSNTDRIQDTRLRAHVKDIALKAYDHAVEQGEIKSTKVMSIIDYELPSTEKRLWVIDMESGKTLFHEQVAHGRNSDRNNDTRVDAGGLSNKPQSKKSSIGVFVTEETYFSTKFKGTALYLDGLEKGFNDNAKERTIVMHPADYADVEEGQRVGRSWGCPAIDPDVSDALIETIKGGSFFVQYYPDKTWLKNSEYLK